VTKKLTSLGKCSLDTVNQNHLSSAIKNIIDLMTKGAVSDPNQMILFHAQELGRWPGNIVLGLLCLLWVMFPFFTANIYVNLTDEEKVYLGKKTNTIIASAEANDAAGLQVVRQNYVSPLILFDSGVQIPSARDLGNAYLNTLGEKKKKATLKQLRAVVSAALLETLPASDSLVFT